MGTALMGAGWLICICLCWAGWERAGEVLRGYRVGPREAVTPGPYRFWGFVFGVAASVFAFLIGRA
jgi:hypothetical protein